ncbi:uncharacterized protein [Miscanthus floridulus]|uniref:uncharacterized protein n=1 Tax=Miscanthus floridulus TaxID=154761 RepID=UPI0034580749
MEAYCKLVRRLEDKFNGLELNHISRKFNEPMDELAKMVSAWAPVPLNIFARDLHKPSIDYALVAEEGLPVEPTAGPKAPSVTKTPSTEPEVMEINVEPPEANQSTDWRASFLDCLIQGELPVDRTEARWLTRRAKTYILSNGEL